MPSNGDVGSMYNACNDVECNTTFSLRARRWIHWPCRGVLFRSDSAAYDDMPFSTLLSSISMWHGCPSSLNDTRSCRQRRCQGPARLICVLLKRLTYVLFSRTCAMILVTSLWKDAIILVVATLHMFWDGIVSSSVPLHFVVGRSFMPLYRLSGTNIKLQSAIRTGTAKVCVSLGIFAPTLRLGLLLYVTISECSVWFFCVSSFRGCFACCQAYFKSY